MRLAFIFAFVACLFTSGCADDPLLKELGLGSSGCKCSPGTRLPALPELPATPAPKRRCPPNGPCPADHVHIGATK